MRDRTSPPEWGKYALIDLAHYLNGRAFKPDDWSVDGARIIRIEQLNNPDGRYDHFQGTISNTNAIDDGDLIFSWSATLKVAIWRHGKGVLNQHLFKVVPKPGFDKHFIFYVLDFHMEALGGASHGSTMKHIKRGNLERHFVSVPSLPRQHRIAEILSTVDEAIEQTEALIAKTQQIKSGLMHDLFTRGVTADGQLRPPREQAPQLYKESPLGWIPKEWQHGCLEHWLLAPPKNGYSPHEVDEWTGQLMLGLGCLTPDGFVPRQLKNAPARDFRVGSALLADGDLLISRANTRELVGLVGMFRDIGQPCSYPDLMMRLRPNTELEGNFLELSLRSPFARRQIKANAVGTSSSMVKISGALVRRLEMAVPGKAEQRRIVQMETSAGAKIEAEQSMLRKLFLQKSGLMQDLLTGHTPVSVDAEPE